jgi:regulatory protein
MAPIRRYTKPPPPASVGEACQLLERFCARRERSPAEVQRRIEALGLSAVDAQTVWEHLVNERFVDEQRFARAFAHDKLRLQRWGRRRIRQALLQQGVQEAVVEQTLQNLDAEVYAEVFQSVLKQKRQFYQGDPHAAWKTRAALLRAGFEADEIEALIS